MPTVPVAAVFNTLEFRRSDGPGQHNAAYAWEQGYTGRGVTIAVVDSGIDIDSPEFAGRISADSRDIYNTRSVESPDDHGTQVTQVAAGARDGKGSLGMAWEAGILALRADRPGSCDGGDPAGECSFTDAAVADAVTFASRSGARVINISLGGGSAGATLTDAIAKAVENGVLIVLAAGNESEMRPSDFTQRISAAGPGGVLVVGSVDEDNAASSFSNRPGQQSANHLMARGEKICCVYEDGKVYVDDEGYLRGFSGTSFAAPQVAGAAALLAQAFPHLTGRQLAQILLESAFDAGEAGPDAVFGRGILNVAAAFRPIGATALAGETGTLALTDMVGETSPAMGDAPASVSLPALVTDQYDRAFGVDLAAGLRGAAPDNRLTGTLASRQRHVAMQSDQASLAFSIDAAGQAALDPRTGGLRLTQTDAERARVLAASIAVKLSPRAAFGFAYRQSAEGIAAQMRGHDRPAFMIATDAGSSAGAARVADLAFGWRQEVGDWGITVSAESGRTLSASTSPRVASLRGDRVEDDAHTYGLALDRAFGPVDLSLGASWTAERHTLLGARFHEAFGLAGADTLFLDADLAWGFAPRWRLGGSLRFGSTVARAGGLVGEGSHLVSNAFSLDLSRRDVLAAGDRLAFRLAQPLRVSGGSLALSLPASWDYATLTATRATRELSLSPEGREVTGELSWTGRLLEGQAAASLFYRRQPGHVAAAPDDTGVTLRWSRGF